MGQVLIHVTMSLNGMIARPNDEIDWAFHYGTDKIVGEVMEEIGAVVLGNRGFREGTMTQDRLPYGGIVHLVDRYVLLIYPLVLGSGRRLLTDGGAFAALHLVNAKATPNGVVVATYEPAEEEKKESSV